MAKEDTFPMLPGLSRDILTVSSLNQIIKRMLERGLDSFWVIGEISNFRVPPSGHFYFTLKDPKSQIAAVMFRSQAQAMAFEPEDGLEVICFGRVSLYSTRGDLQLYVESMEPRGKGALHLAFEQLKKRLWKEGLFDPGRKRELPFLPKSIGIVTSLGGAALGDMLRILEDRFPQRRVIIRPVTVQGDGAASEVAEGIRELGESGLVDVMIVGRGGGSLEDLWAFNEEVVARAIFAAPVPVISAVGHEIDVTIADFVADHRAPTPTAAAETVVPRRDELGNRVQDLESRLVRAVQGALSGRRGLWERWARRLMDPTRRLRENQMRLDDLSVSLWRRYHNSVERCKGGLTQLSGRLGSLSPMAVLERGYSIVYQVPHQLIVKDGSSLKVGDRLRITYARGSSLCKVERSE